MARSPAFETPLSGLEEAQYRRWKASYAPEDSGEDYDYRGAFKAGAGPDYLTGHWPDTFKKPNHPTFSNQSVYAPPAPERAGSWVGERYIPPGASRTSYDPVLEAHAPQSGGLYPSWWDAEAEKGQSVPAQVADFIFGPEWAFQRRKAEATPPWSAERWRFGGNTLFPFLMMGGGGALSATRPRPTLPRIELPPGPIKPYNPDVFVPGKPFDPETFVTEPPSNVWGENLPVKPGSWGNINDRKYSGPLQGQEWADLYATPDVDFTVKPRFSQEPSNMTPEERKLFEDLNSGRISPEEHAAEMRGEFDILPPPSPSKARDPTEIRRDLLENNPTEYWKLYSRGLLPGNKNTQMWGNTAFDIENWNFAPRSQVPPPYDYKSPLKITPEDNLPLPPATDITPPDDRMWWYKQPRPPFLSEVIPQMNFTPQTDWMQQLYQSQLYPDELNWRVA
jgi:hypothetical protein